MLSAGFFLWRKTALYRTYIFLFLNVQMIFCEMVLVDKDCFYYFSIHI